MDDTKQSKYTIYSGRAAEDLALNGTELKVIVPELTPSALSGTFAAGTTQTDVKMKNLTGGSVDTSVTTANHIVAVWEGTSNTSYPPAIKKGEQVEIVQRSDSDRFHWREMGRDRELRQLDRYRIEVSATKALNTAKNDTNTYFLEMDAVAGTVTIKTAKANKEPFAYVVRIDTKSGTVLIGDDAEGTPNRIFLDSGANGGVPTIHLNNSKKASVVLLGEDIIINAPRDIMLNAGRQIVSTAKVATLNWDIARINGITLGVSASESVVFKAPTVDVLGSLKTTGWSTAYRMRAQAYYTGASLTSERLPTTTPENGTGQVGGNVPDTAEPADQRHAAAYEQLTLLAATATDWFVQIRNQIGVPVADGTLNAYAVASEMRQNAGT